MREFRRPAVVVPTLAAKGAGGKKRSNHIQDYQDKGTHPLKFPGHWTSPDVRGALYAMQGRICAYCGADIDEAGIDVEHFRPKSNVAEEKNHGGYWWLAYEFTNYILSCVVCNQRYKGDQFPLLDGAIRVRYENQAQLPGEGRILLDPTLDPVEEWIKVEWDKTLPKLSPNPQLEPALQDRVRRAIDFFRLNQKAPQLKKRMAIQRQVLEKVDANQAQEVRDLAVRFRPHSIVAKQILEALAPHALPTPEEELEWLLGELAEELLLKLDDLSSENRSKLDEREAQELIWALAVLLKSPPVATPQFVQQYLQRRGLIEKVEEFAARL